MTEHPVHFAIRYPEKLSGGLNLPFFIGTVVKFILALPIIVVAAVANGGLNLGSGDPDFGGSGGSGYGVAASGMLYYLAPFAIVFLARYPRGLWTLTYGLLRVEARLATYLFALTDRWPVFALDEREGDPFEFEIPFPEELNRWLNFPILGTLVKAILCIPHFIVLFFLALVAVLLLFIAQFAILFSGRFPESMFRFIAGMLQYGFRVAAYVYSMTDRYPPFDIDPGELRGPSTEPKPAIP
ncbi:MAG: DUF4389 domain-containing protein [Dehalococcoidia bacterium]